MRPLLPQLRNTMAPGPIQGEWNISSKSIFGTIAQALKYEQAVRTNINSIPSPWARALLFQSVFLTDQYPNRQELINEYIGFLAVLAFARVKDLAIQAKQVNLGELSKSNPFADSLVGLLPSAKDSVLLINTRENPWQTIFTFTLNGSPLGFTSPATLAVPSISLQPQLAALIPWIEEVPILASGSRGKTVSRYGDPKHHLGQQEKAAFASWLGNIKQAVLVANGPNQDLSNRLGMILDEYLQDFGVAGKTAPTIATSVQIFGVALNPRPLDALAQVVDPEAIKRSSNVQVLQGHRIHPRPLYFVDKAIVPQVLNQPAHDICVEGATTLAAFQPISASNTQKGVFWSGDQFFLPRLRWYRGSGMSGSWLEEIQPDRESRMIIPPINPELAQFFGSDDLRSRLKMVQTNTSEGYGVRVSLEIQISGLGNQPTNLAISKDYPIKSEDELQGELPYIALWPNLPSESRWKKYYLTVLESNDRSNSKFAFAVDMPGRNSKASTLDGDLGTIFRVFQTTEHPDILSLVDRRGDYLGIIPILAPQVTTGRSGRWTVGVDFGTSFTNLHVSKSGARERLELSMLTLNITDKAENFDYNKDFFVPSILTAPQDGTNPPMATLLTLRGASESDMTPDFITKSRIYDPSLDEPSLRDFVVSDIKWTKPKYLDAFLIALINMVSAHAANEDVSEITWKASYPTAFSEYEVSRYKNAWERALRGADGLSIIRHRLGNDGSAASAFKTESIAFAQYFADELDEQLNYTTCLDVGGGTSDISIWKNMTLVHQLSIPFAGRDVFHNTLKRNNARIGEVFGLSDMETLNLLVHLKESGENFDAYLDSYLRLRGGSVFERIRNSENTEAIQRFRGLLAFAYGGLYYYIGLVLRYLNQEDATPVYLGGNGSRFINWIEPDGQYSESSNINKVLSYILAKAGNYSTDQLRDTILSKYPKQEAAGGLIVDNTRLRGLSSSGPEAYAGISMKFVTDVGTLTFRPEDELKLPEDCQEIRSIAIDDFTEIGNFIETFNEAIRVCGVRDLLSPITAKNAEESLEGIRFDLDNEVKTLLNNRRSMGDGSRQNYEPDPGFIVAHKALLRVLAKQWARI